MVKIQEMKRSNGSTVNNVTIPKFIMLESGLVKSDNVEFECDKDKNIIIKKVL